MALEQNRTLKLLHEQHEAATDQWKAYQTNLLPKLSARANYLYSTANATLPLVPGVELEASINSLFTAGVSLEQPIYQGGKIRTAIRMAHIGTTMASLNVRKGEAEVVASTDEAFFSCLKMEELLNCATAYRDVVHQLLLQMEQAHRVGMKSKNDLLKVQVACNEATLKVMKAENGVRLARMNLCHWIGLPLTTTSLRLTHPLPLVTSLTERNLDVTARPEYALLQQQLALKQEGVKLVASDYLPQVGMIASYNYANGIEFNGTKLLNNPSFMGGVTVSVPLFSWGEGRKKRSVARHEVEMTRHQFAAVTEQMQLEKMQAINQLDEASLQLSFVTTALEQAAENLKVSRNQYEAGMESLANLLEAQAIWQQAASSLVEARAQQRLAHTHYLKASGGVVH